MVDNVKELKIPLHTSLTVAQALGDAQDYGLKDVLIIGWDKDEELYSVGSRMTRQEALWLLEQARLHLLGFG